ncbi:MAG: arginase, partial [Bacteroidota bacterium]
KSGRWWMQVPVKISRYAGLSDKVTSAGFYGFRSQWDQRDQTAQVVAQLIWYFVDGVYHRKNDYPSSTDSLVEYIVDFRDQEYQITFWKSNKSGRWWMQVPVKTKRKHERHTLIPCSYQDYQLASQEELPQRLLDAYKRFM